MVITSYTGTVVVGNTGPWVRIPLTPPNKYNLNTIHIYEKAIKACYLSKICPNNTYFSKEFKIQLITAFLT